MFGGGNHRPFRHLVNRSDRSAVVASVRLEIKVVEQLEKRFSSVAGVDAVFRGDTDPETRAEGLV